MICYSIFLVLIFIFVHSYILYSHSFFYIFLKFNINFFFNKFIIVEVFKYLKTTINSRGVITPALKALKKRTNICMQVIHKLSTDMATRLDIFGVYIQSHFIGCLVVLAFAPKTTVTAFCTHFMTTLEKVGDHHKHFKVRELLIAINKIHPLDMIQRLSTVKIRN